MSRYDRAATIARTGGWLAGIALVGLVVVYVRALAFTPIERFQGPAQKIYYVHVPTAWAALMAFSITGIVSLLYLWLRDRKLDVVASSSAEVGLAFSVAMLTTGPIWGKPIWGTWWSWDARLTSTLFIFLLFIAYLVLRNAIGDPDQRARYSAVLGTLAIVLVPFIHMTVYMFRTLHPQPIIAKPGAPSLPGEMLLTFFMSLAVFTLLYVGFVMQRYALAVFQDVREEEAARAIS